MSHNVVLAFCCVLLILIGFTASQNVNGQLSDCRELRSCNTETVSNGCRQTIRWTRCDGTLGTRYTQCTNTGCISGCECNCIEGANGGYSQAWENTCTGIVHSSTHECDGCSPTPTPTPTPTPSPTPTPTPDPSPTPPDTGGGGECPCNDCVYGCSGGGGGNCQWVTVPGQCYEGWEEWDPYTGTLIIHYPYCDPDQLEYVCD
jgi:hypothetical protein